MSHVHAGAVYALCTLTIGLLLIALRAKWEPVVQAAALLLLVEVTQGAVGFTQYFLDLPEGLVAAHLLGAALTSAALTWVVLRARASSRSTRSGTTGSG
jgi:cytochrome c oxidase assembly protein subunit 15